MFARIWTHKPDWPEFWFLFSSLSRITPILADSVFHLFIQSNLTRKEMENFISGRDKRDLVDIIDPTVECQRYKDRRCTCHSTVDSGYSGSVQPDEESRGISDGKFPLFTRLRKWLLWIEKYVIPALKKILLIIPLCLISLLWSQCCLSLLSRCFRIYLWSVNSFYGLFCSEEGGGGTLGFLASRLGSVNQKVIISKNLLKDT